MSERQEKFSGTREVDDRHRFDLEALQDYMEDHVEGFSGRVAVRQFRGGQSNPTYLVEAGGKKYVLRRRPPGKLLPSAHAVHREYRVIEALADTNVPVPRVYCLCEDDAVVGTWFFIMEFVEGRVLWEATLPDLEPAQRFAIYDAMNETLARLHGVDYEAVGLGDFGKPGNYFARQIHRWTQQYRLSETESIDAMNQLIEWLPENIPEGDEATIVHGDYRLDNMIFHPHRNEILALLDWELSTIGHPLGDFSYHCMQWSLDSALGRQDLETLGIPTLERYVDAYCRRTGRQGIGDWDFYLAYNLFRSAGISQGIVGRVRDGTAASAWATEIGASVRPTAERAWDLVSARQAK